LALTGQDQSIAVKLEMCSTADLVSVANVDIEKLSVLQ